MYTCLYANVHNVCAHKCVHVVCMCIHTFMYLCMHVCTHVHETQESNKEFIYYCFPSVGRDLLSSSPVNITLLNSTSSSFWGIAPPPKGLILGRW